MRVLSAQFMKSATRLSEWPAADGRKEIAVCGRSNVGKSSLLNQLLQKGVLARVSKTPGRTRLLNFFSVECGLPSGARERLLVTDLPGFGYAEVHRSERATWQHMIDEYFRSRQSLVSVLLLCDGRRVMDPKADALLFDERELAHYLDSLGRIVTPVLTKADKLTKGERKPAAQRLERVLGLPRAVHSAPVICSAQTTEGFDDLWRSIHRACQVPASSPAIPHQSP